MSEFLNDLYVDLACIELALAATQNTAALMRIRAAKAKVNAEIVRPFAGMVVEQSQAIIVVEQADERS